MSTTEPRSAAVLAELRQKAKLPARQAGGSTIKAFFEANKTAIAAVLPKHMSPERMLHLAVGAVRTTPQLMECTTESLFAATIVSAKLGLEPNTPLGHAYLVPYRNRRKGITEVQLIPGYRGLIDLARRSGQVISIAAHEVCRGDVFEFEYGLDEKLRHVPGEHRGEMTHVYAVAKLVGGGYAFEVLTRSDVDRIMRSSQSRGESGPWKDHYVAMARKSAVRQLFKWLPMSIEMAQAERLDATVDGGKVQDFSAVLRPAEDALDGDFTVVDDEAPPAEDDAPTAEAEPAKDTEPRARRGKATADPSAAHQQILVGIERMGSVAEFAEWQEVIAASGLHQDVRDDLMARLRLRADELADNAN